MQSKVAPFAATPDPTHGRTPQPSAPDRPAPGETVEPVEEADLRLVIEEDEASGTYVYKTVNRRTGEVVQQLPREQVLRLRDDADYLAGGVIRTKA
jgi:flagellar protein FlaG